MVTAQNVLDFWFVQTPREFWYNSSPELDSAIKERYFDIWEQARMGQLSAWSSKPTTMLALILVLDQFPRNMFRNDRRAFQSDAMARQMAKAALKRDWDLRFEDLQQRQFFYLPLMHSENQTDQDRCVRLIKERLNDSAHADQLVHARAHREVIRRYGRFPYRNDSLGRSSSTPEQEFLQQGGYRLVMEELSRTH